MKKIIFGVSVALLIGCNQQSRDLDTEIINDNLCIYTNESKDYGEDSFLVHIGKVDYSKEYQSEYEKSYEHVKFPIDKKSCVSIPLNKIEKNIAYTINLSTINRLFSSQICILDKQGSVIIRPVQVGKDICD